jgi:alkylated DNA repair dioxygenase AlkB
VQHYGYRYDYTRKQLDASLYLGPLPIWAAELARRLHRDAFIAAVPDQLIVNEYLPGHHDSLASLLGSTLGSWA